MGDGDLLRAARELAQRLDREGIPYALAGALALGFHGYRRFTADIDIILTREGLARFKERYLGLGYAEKFAGSKGLRDTAHNVAIDVLLAGEMPGDGKPKPVAIPDPSAIPTEGVEFRVVALPKLIELKLASGMTAPHRMRDLADVIELIRAANLPLSLADQLDPWVRDKFTELWNAAQGVDPE